MTREQWLKRFSLAARWRLPPNEATEAIEDYRELLAERSPDTDENLLQELGEPFHAAQILGTQKDHLLWTVVFSVLCGLLLLPAGWLYFGRAHPVLLYETAFAFALCLSLVWRYKGPSVKEKKYPAALLKAELGLLAAAALTAAWITFLFYDLLYGKAHILANLLPPDLIGPIVHFPLKITAGLSVCGGIFGLCRCRLSDRRWLGLYILAVTLSLLCGSLAGLFTTLSDPDAIPFALREMLLPAVIGFSGAVWLQC